MCQTSGLPKRPSPKEFRRLCEELGVAHEPYSDDEIKELGSQEMHLKIQPWWQNLYQALALRIEALQIMPLRRLGEMVLLGTGSNLRTLRRWSGWIPDCPTEQKSSNYEMHHCWWVIGEDGQRHFLGALTHAVGSKVSGQGTVCPWWGWQGGDAGWQEYESRRQQTQVPIQVVNWTKIPIEGGQNASFGFQLGGELAGMLLSGNCTCWLHFERRGLSPSQSHDEIRRETDRIQIEKMLRTWQDSYAIWQMAPGKKNELLRELASKTIAEKEREQIKEKIAEWDALILTSQDVIKETTAAISRESSRVDNWLQRCRTEHHLSAWQEGEHLNSFLSRFLVHLPLPLSDSVNLINDARKGVLVPYARYEGDYAFDADGDSCEVDRFSNESRKIRVARALVCPDCDKHLPPAGRCNCSASPAVVEPKFQYFAHEECREATAFRCKSCPQDAKGKHPLSIIANPTSTPCPRCGAVAWKLDSPPSHVWVPVQTQTLDPGWQREDDRPPNSDPYDEDDDRTVQPVSDDLKGDDCNTRQTAIEDAISELRPLFDSTSKCHQQTGQILRRFIRARDHENAIDNLQDSVEAVCLKWQTTLGELTDSLTDVCPLSVYLLRHLADHQRKSK